MKNPENNRRVKVKVGWFIWFFPAVALGISAWLFWEYFRQRGPEIEIYFEDASGLQAGKTKIRYRGVTIGSVNDITLSEDNKDVVAHVALQRDAAHVAVEGSKFWVVLPKVGFQGISGLETIFEGTYISVKPGKPDGAEKLTFKGETGDPLDESVFEGTTHYVLETENVDSVNTGDNVTFRGLPIGTVTRTYLAKGAQAVWVQINVQNKFVKVIRTNTAFWRKSAVQAKLGLFGSEVKIGSMDSIMRGGIEVFTPDQPGEIAKSGTHFRLEGNAPKGSEKWNPKLE